MWDSAVWFAQECREEKFAYQYWVPPKILMGKDITGTNYFACFSRKIICTREAEKKSQKMLSSRYWCEDLITHFP